MAPVRREGLRENAARGPNAADFAVNTICKANLFIRTSTLTDLVGVREEEDDAQHGRIVLLRIRLGSWDDGLLPLVPHPRHELFFRIAQALVRLRAEPDPLLQRDILLGHRDEKVAG